MAGYETEHYVRLKEIKTLCNKVNNIKSDINNSITQLDGMLTAIESVLFHKNCYWDGYWWDSDGAWYDEEGKKHALDGTVTATSGFYMNGLWCTGDGYYYATDGTRTFRPTNCYYNNLWYDENGSYYDTNGYRHDINGTVTYMGNYIYTYDGYYCDYEGYYYDAAGVKTKYKFPISFPVAYMGTLEPRKADFPGGVTVPDIEDDDEDYLVSCYKDGLFYDEDGAYYDTNGYRHNRDGTTEYIGNYYYDDPRTGGFGHGNYDEGYYYLCFSISSDYPYCYYDENGELQENLFLYEPC